VAALSITALLAGPPLILIRLRAVALPEQLPTPAAGDRQSVHQVILAAAALTGLLTLTAILAGVAVHAGRATARLARHLPRIRAPRPLQGLSAAVLGTVTVTSAAAPAAAHAQAHTSHGTLADTLTKGLLAGQGASLPIQPQATASLASTDTAQQVDEPPVSVRTATASPGRLTLLVSGQQHSYVVHRGDNLSRIARDWLGDPNRWPEIYHLNRGRHFPNVGGTLINPNLIYPGWVLTLPDDARPPSHNPSAVPNPAPPNRTQAPSAPAAPPIPGSSTTPSNPAGPVTGPASPSATASPSASRAASAQPSPSTCARAVPSSRTSAFAPARTDRQAPPVSRRDIGVRLPGGWIPIPFAAALIAAAALVWRRRRHRYVPGKLAGPVLRDPDLQPLPPAITVLRRGVRRHAPDLLPRTPEAEAVPAGDAADAIRLPVGEPTVTATSDVLPPIGPSGPDLAGLGTALRTGGLGLVGDGAHAAARAMLVATLSSGTPDDPDARGQVVIPVDTLTTLLGGDTVHLSPTPRLTVTANLGQALTRLEELVIERRRTLQDDDADDLETMRAADPMHPPMPPVLLIAEVPGPQARARLTRTLPVGTPLQINAVLVGDWPGGDTLDVDTEGYTDSDTTDRLAVLDTTTTTVQLLQMLSEAHTGQPTPPPASASVGPSTIDDAGPREGPPERGLPELDTAQEHAQASTSPGPPPVGPPRDDTTPAAAAAAGTGRVRVPVRVLGRPALGTDGVPGQPLRRRAQELLVYLAVHRAGANLPDIKEAFWPDASNRRAGERLQTEVGDLRRRIRYAYRGINTDTGPEEQVQPVVNTGGRYHLNPDLVDVDWWSVQDALAATTHMAHRVEHLRRAVEAFHGPLAEGCGYDWLPEMEEHVRRRGIIAYTQLAQLVADTDPQEAARLLDQATVLDRYNEDLARAAMRAHTRLRDADAVRAQLHRIRAALDDIDLEPDEQTTTLATDLLRQITKPPAPPHEPPRP